MSFKTSADRYSGYYGKWVYDKKAKTSTFAQLGKEVLVDRVIDNIETGDTNLTLSFDYMGEVKRVSVSRAELADNTLIQTLAAKGADVTKKHFDILVDTIRQQEESMALYGQRAEKVYTHLGWLKMPIYDSSGAIVGSRLCYRANELLGGVTAKYEGEYSVAPMGSFDTWKEMVKADVVGNSALEFVLIAGLSAVVNGLIAPQTTGENPIVHLCCGSSQGKTTALFLATSVSGEPFDGERKAHKKNGEKVRRCSIYGSWGATENATIAQCAGNRGAVIVLNELGKFKASKDMSQIVYDLSEGTDKARLNIRLETQKAESYVTTILSAGEISLLGRCANKLEGLHNRVMEIEQPLTNSAEHSRRIKEVCRKNNGWAGPALAQYIIDNGGIEMVLPMYRDFCRDLVEKLPASTAKERFVEKFAALFMTTAALARAALDIPFNLDSLMRFFADYVETKGQERNISASSYEAIIEACRINKRSFYIEGEPDPTVRSFGRIKYPNKALDDGRVVVEEYEIRRDFLNRVLKENGYPNIRTCANEWKAKEVLDYEAGHLTRSRKIDKDSNASEDVFVFRVFDADAGCEQNLPAKPCVNTPASRLENQGGDIDA